MYEYLTYINVKFILGMGQIFTRFDKVSLIVSYFPLHELVMLKCTTEKKTENYNEKKKATQLTSPIWI